ncbi:MAG: hypothetical protein QM760_11425 [Nibricoccus sp.]
MKLTEKLGRIFQTETHVARSAKIIAEHFSIERRETARCVVLSLVSVLCVNVEHISPQTDIVKDLGADEDWEWAEIFLSIEEHLARRFQRDRRFEGRTVSELIEFITTMLSHPNEERA